MAACAQQQQQKEVPLIYRRYSIRYSPGDATIPPGYGTELSVLWDDANGGRSANEVCRIDGPWYPQAWPSALASEVAGLADLVENKMPVAEERRAARKQEMKPYLKQLAHEHQQRRKQEPPGAWGKTAPIFPLWLATHYYYCLLLVHTLFWFCSLPSWHCCWDQVA